MMKAWQHFKTITTHKMWVMRYCFKIGLYWQGLTHDLSKYFADGISGRHEILPGRPESQ